MNSKSPTEVKAEEMNKKNRRLLCASASALSILILQGCSSGSLGSDVGDVPNAAPLAVASVLNGGGSSTFRTGSEVLLTGKDSEDPDGPIIDWEWSQTGGPTVLLKEVNASTVSFTVPNAADSAQLNFELRVIDSDGESSTQSVSVTAKAILDANRFLANDFSTTTVENVLTVIPSQASTATSAAEAAYQLSVQAYVVYPGTGDTQDCNAAMRVPTDDEVSLGALSPPLQGCFVQLQENLVTRDQDASATLSDQWPIDVDPAAPGSSAPRHVFRIPNLDVAAVNQALIDNGMRDRFLELYNVSNAFSAVRIEVIPADMSKFDRLRIESGSANVVQFDEALTSAWISIEGLLPPNTESSSSANEYYEAVDPAGKRLTLFGWQCNAGFGDPAGCSSNNPTGQLRDVAINGTDTATETFAHAVYLNNFDLGFGRDMYMRVDTETGNVYSFVNNYGTLEGAIRKVDPLVSVVMEYSPPEDMAGDPIDGADRYVKFFTYAPDGTGDYLRVNSFDFDNRGHLPTPGNCTVCHGGTNPGEEDFTQTNGDLNATFLPWDIESFYFMDTDPAITDAMPRLDGSTLLEELQALETTAGQFSRANQIAQVKKLNEGALFTYLDQDPAVSGQSIALVNLLYDGPDDTDDQTLEGDFREGQVPAEWDEAVDPMIPAGAANFYSTVYAQHCRMCHTSISDNSLWFDTYGAFAAEVDSISDTVTNGLMPAARLTMDRLWAPHGSSSLVPGDVLADFIETSGGARPTLTNAAVASIDLAGAPFFRGSTIAPDGSSSVLADSYLWTVLAPDGSPVPVGGSSTPTPLFGVGTLGTHSVTLAVNPDQASENTASLNIEVENRPPNAAADSGYSLDVTSQTVLVSADPTQTSGPMFITDNDSDPDGDAFDITVVGSVVPATAGSVVVNPDGSFTYTYAGDTNNPPPNASFTYTITDVVAQGFELSDMSTVTIGLSGDETPPTNPILSPVQDESTFAGAASNFRLRLNWTTSTDSQSGLSHYRIIRTDPNSVVTETIVPAGTTTFRDDNLLSNAMYQYEVEAEDNSGNISDRSQQTGTTNVSYTSIIDPIWDDRDCTNCHVGSNPNSGGFPMRLDQSEQANYDCIRGTSCNVVITNPNPPPPTLPGPQQDRAAATDASSLIACKAADVCGSHPNTDISNNGGVNNPDYLLIELWLQQGRNFN